MKIEVCHAAADRITRITVDLPEGATVGEAIRASAILDGLHRDPGPLTYGVFGRRVDADAVLVDGDRVELLRPLIVDPKEARHRRVAVKRQGRPIGRMR